MKILYNIKEAAKFLSMSKHDIIDLAAKGLPVLFFWRGNLGIYAPPKPPRPIPRQSPIAYFDGYLRSLERVSLKRRSEHFSETESAVTFPNVQKARWVEAVINNSVRPDPPALEKGQFYTRLDADGRQMIHSPIPESDWLFHIDDLRPLIEPGVHEPDAKPATNPPPSASDAEPDAESQGNINSESPIERAIKIKNRHDALKASGDKHPTKTLADENDLTEGRIRQLLQKAKVQKPKSSIAAQLNSANRKTYRP